MGEWIVVVDDDAFCLTNARMILTSEGMKVSCLRSGHDLLRFIEKNTPDLILLDIMMPEMDGFSSLQALRKKEEALGRTMTPVIFLTGDDDFESERRGLTEGASDFVHKPFQKEILLSRIQKTLQNRKTLETLLEKATYDKLTGLLNKGSGTEKISKHCADENGTLMIVDLDSFKSVNDIFGHDMGDKVLQGFAHILKDNVGERDTVSRIGGDEFLAFLADQKDADKVIAFVDHLNQLLLSEAARLMGEDFGLPLGVSAGAVFVPEYGRDYDVLFQNADSSLYHVKQNGKHACLVYNESKAQEKDKDDILTELERVTKLVEERGEVRGALVLGPEAFSGNYRFIMRLLKRNGMKASRLLFTIRPQKEKFELSQAVTAFGELLRTSLRSHDMIMQSRHNSYFLLLPEVEESDASVVVDRILNTWAGSEYAEYVEVLHIVKNSP